MSTRSYISLMKDNGYIESVYCHFDGYLDGVGLRLYDHYNTYDKVQNLIRNGAISSLKDNIDSTTFYHRDRGEDLVVETYQEEHQIPHEDFNYLFKYGEWYVTTLGSTYLLETALNDLD